MTVSINFTAAGGGGGGGGAAISAGANSQNTGTIAFSNSNGVTFGLAAGIVTASIAGTVAGGTALVNLSAGTTSGAASAFTFGNANGVSFGLNASTITASVAAQSNQTLAGYALGQTTGQSSSSGALDARSLSFSGLGGVSVGLSAGAVVISGAAGGGGGAALSAGTQSVSTGTVNFANSNGVTFGMSGSNQITASFSAPPVQTNQTIGGYALGNTTAQSSSSGGIDARSLSFSGLGAASVGYSAGAVVISVAAGGQSNQSLGIYGSSQTTGQSSSSTYDARSLSIVGAGAISVGWSAGSLIISDPGTTALPQISVGFSTQGNTSGNTGLVTGQALFVGGNNITLSGSTNAGSMSITISAGAAGGSVNFSAGTTSGNLASVVFSNSNGVSFGLNGSTVTGSVAAQSNQSVGLYALGNTTQNSSTTLDARTLSFNALGAMTMGYSNGSIQVSAPATSSLSATGGVSISTNGSTISIGYSAPALTRYMVPRDQLTAVTAPGQGSASLQYVRPEVSVTATRLDALFAWAAASSATTNTAAIAISAWAAIYTRNAGTLSSLSSGSTQTTYTYASNTAGNTQLISSAVRPISVPININMAPGEYFVAFNMSTNSSSVGLSTTNLAQTISVMGGNQLQTANNYAEFTNQTATSMGLLSGMGVYSAQTAGLPAAISLSAINQTGSALSAANIGLVFRNN